MILSAAEHGLRVILQTDHAALSGALAAHWGNAVFRRPEPTQAMLLAAAEHDNGWREWEDRPRVNPTTRRPRSRIIPRNNPPPQPTSSNGPRAREDCKACSTNRT